MKIAFNRSYFLLFTLLFITETLIAAFLKSGFIRHTFGDFLAVILLYSFLKSLWEGTPITAVIIVLFISFLVEFLQLTQFLEVLGLENNKLAKTILGSTFEVSDLVAYSLGALCILIIELKFLKTQ